MSMTSDNTIAKILRAIERNGGTATVTKIRRSIAEFNQGGVKKLQQYLADLVTKGTLMLHKDKGGNGQTVESYSIANSNIPSDSNNNGNANSNGNLSIAVTLDITLEKLMEIVHSIIRVDDGNDNDNDDTTDEYTDEEYDINPDDDSFEDTSDLPMHVYKSRKKKLPAQYGTEMATQI